MLERSNARARRGLNKFGADTRRFFNKDVAGGLKKVGGAFEEVGDAVVGAGKETLEGLKDAGNFLEKNASMIGTGLAAASIPALMATGVGAPVAMGIAGGIMGAGATAQQFGSDVKRVTSDARRGLNAVGGEIRSGVSMARKEINAIADDTRKVGKSVMGDVRRDANAIANNARLAGKEALGAVRREANQFGSAAQRDIERFANQVASVPDSVASLQRQAVTDPNNSLSIATLQPYQQTGSPEEIRARMYQSVMRANGF